MGRYLSSTLAYGIQFGSSGDWNFVEDPKTYAPVHGGWYQEPENETEDNDFFAQAVTTYLTACGVDIPNGARRDFYALCELLKLQGLYVVTYGMEPYEESILATYERYIGFVGAIDPTEIHDDTMQWDDKLEHFFEVLGLQPKVRQGQWLVCTSYG